MDDVFFLFFVFLARTPTGIFGLRRAVEDESIKHEVAHQSTNDRRQATMSGSEYASDGSGNTSNNKKSSSRRDWDEIASALATPTSSVGAAASTTPPADRQQELAGPAEMATLRANNGRSVTVRVVSSNVGKNAKRPWVWQVFHQISPSINNKNVFRRMCKHLCSCGNPLAELPNEIPTRVRRAHEGPHYSR